MQRNKLQLMWLQQNYAYSFQLRQNFSIREITFREQVAVRFYLAIATPIITLLLPQWHNYDILLPHSYITKTRNTYSKIIRIWIYYTAGWVPPLLGSRSRGMELKFWRDLEVWRVATRIKITCVDFRSLPFIIFGLSAYPTDYRQPYKTWDIIIHNCNQ